MSSPPPASPARRRPRSPDETRLAVQALCRGKLTTKVTAITEAVARPAPAHVAIRYGRVLLYLEDRAALTALAQAVDRALQLGDEVFGPERDAFTWSERRDRASCAHTGIYPGRTG